MKKKHLSIREQYKLAYRLLRMRMFDEVSRYYAEQYAKSFGITADVLDAAIRSFYSISDFRGWLDFNRQCEFYERQRQLTPPALDDQVIPEWLLELETDPAPDECPNCAALGMAQPTHQEGRPLMIPSFGQAWDHPITDDDTQPITQPAEYQYKYPADF